MRSEKFLSGEKMNSPPLPDPYIEEQEENPKLTIKQERFIDAYIETGNGAEAARQAGYSEHTARAMACENLTKPYMIKAITKRRSELMQDSEEKIALYLSRLEQESESQDNSGSERIRSLELLIKANGGFTDRHEVVNFDGAFLADLDLDEPESKEPDPAFLNENKDLH